MHKNKNKNTDPIDKVEVLDHQRKSDGSWQVHHSILTVIALRKILLLDMDRGVRKSMTATDQGYRSE